MSTGGGIDERAQVSHLVHQLRCRRGMAAVERRQVRCEAISVTRWCWFGRADVHLGEQVVHRLGRARGGPGRLWPRAKDVVQRGRCHGMIALGG
eukprot:876197-Prorocentrum_minimum.AAC.2